MRDNITTTVPGTFMVVAFEPGKHHHSVAGKTENNLRTVGIPLLGGGVYRRELKICVASDQ